MRDFVREQIKESTGQDLIFILLEVSEEEYLKRSTIRLKDFVERILGKKWRHEKVR